MTSFPHRDRGPSAARRTSRTVGRPDRSGAVMGLEPEAWDVLHTVSRPNWHWSRGNIGEALPGVLTPLSWSLWEVAADGSARAAFRAIGAADSAEAVVPADRSRRCIRAFYGRAAAQLEFLCEMGDRVPGTSASAIAEHVFGEVPQGI